MSEPDLDRICDVKTIALTIDEATLYRIDRLVGDRRLQIRNRSQAVRLALREFIQRLKQPQEEDRERKIIRKHASLLRRQAIALVKEQVRP